MERINKNILGIIIMCFIIGVIAVLMCVIIGTSEQRKLISLYKNNFLGTYKLSENPCEAKNVVKSLTLSMDTIIINNKKYTFDPKTMLVSNYDACKVLDPASAGRKWHYSNDIHEKLYFVINNVYYRIERMDKNAYMLLVETLKEDKDLYFIYMTKSEARND